MHPRVRTVSGGLVGSLCGIVVFAVMQQVGSVIFPPPRDFDWGDPAKLRQLFQDMPTGAALLLIFGYSLGSLVGGGVAAWIAGPTGYRSALIVGLALTIAGGINFFFINPYHPVWVTLLCLCCFIPCAWLGALSAHGAKSTRGAAQEHHSH